MRKILLFMIFGMLALSYPTANTDAQTGTTYSSLTDLYVTNVVSNVSLIPADNCDFPLNGPAIANMHIFFYASVTFGDMDIVRDMSRVFTHLYDSSGNEIGIATQGIEHGISGVPYETTAHDDWFSGIWDGSNITTRPWILSIRDQDREIGRTTFDPAQWVPSCSYLPYVGDGEESQSVNQVAIDNGFNASLYLGSDDNGNPSLDVYGINDDGEGYYQFSITQDLLAPYADNPPAQNTELASADNVTLYMLTTGEYQLNIGPDDEGKVRVIIFEGLPPTNVYSYDFNVYDILEE